MPRPLHSPRPPRYDFALACRELAAADPKLGRLIERAGPFTLRVASAQSPVEALVESIVYQQLHGKAAATIHRRLLESFHPLCGEQHPSAQHLLDCPNEQLRAAGLSHNKSLAIRDLAAKALDGTVPTLVQIRRALKPDGLLLAAMLGGDTLTELRQSFAVAEAECEGGISPRVSPSADLRDVGGLLQRAGFALPVTDLDRIVVRYDNAFGLMRDLRSMGATNILNERRRRPTRRATMLRMAEVYQERFADSDGRIRATFDVLWLSGWAPHESQQKPAKPGSAKASLEAAVKSVKRP